MKLIVREHIIAIAEPVKKVFNVTIDAINAYGKIPASIGIKKGDLIVFRGEGDPVRLPAGNVNGRILVTDDTTETGWAIIPNSSSSGSSVTLNNITGTLVKGGTVVKIQSDYDFVKATSADTSTLFVTGDDCPAGVDVVCYGVANTICSVLCTEDEVAIGDQLGVSSTDGLAHTVSGNGFAKALTAKESGSTGTVEAIIMQNGFLPLEGGTINGDLKIEKNQRAKLTLSSADGNHSDITAYKPSQNTYGSVLVINAGGNAVIGSGEFAQTAYDNDVESCQDDAERLLLGSDTNVYLSTNAQTIGNRKKWTFGSDGSTQLPAALGLAYGGTGAASRLNALKNLTNENVGANATYFLTITDSWAKGGYTSVANARSVLYSYGTSAPSTLETGKLFFVYKA